MPQKVISSPLMQMRYFLILWVLKFFIPSLVAQKQAEATFFDTLYRLEIDHVELHLNIDTLLANKLKDRDQDGTINIFSGEKEIKLPVQISVRSKSRRRYCDFPPIKLDFVKSDLKEMGLDNEDEYKIVTHCLDVEEGEEVLLKELLAYQLYRILTPNSLRAKLIDIQYIDDESDKKINKKAVLLESENEFAKNHDSKLCDCMGSPVDSIDALQMEIVAMFQYMIGNTDMDHMVERNLTLMIPKSGGKWMPVAYDFDFSGLVNAPYVHTKVADNRNIKRIYLGFKENASYLPEVIQLFLSKEDEILNEVKNFELISNRERRACLKYIQEFYDEIKQDDLVLPYKK